MKIYILAVLAPALLSGCMPLYFLWAELNPREAYQSYWGGRNIDPVPEAEIDTVILMSEFDGVCQPRVFVDGMPVYAAVNISDMALREIVEQKREFDLFYKYNIEFLNKSSNKKEDCQKFTLCLSEIAKNFIKIGEYPYAIIYQSKKNNQREFYISHAVRNLHMELNADFSIEKCLINPNSGKYFRYNPWFGDK